MSKITKEQAQEALETLNAFVEQTDGEAAEATEAVAVTIPSSEEVAALKKDEVLAKATELGIDVEGQKVPVIKARLLALAKINADEELGEDDDLNDLAEALGLTPDKKAAKTLAAVKEWASALGQGGEASTEETTEETTEEATEEEPVAEEEATEETTEEETTDGDADATEETPADDAATPAEEDATGDNVDREKIAKGFKKFPDAKIMIERLEKFNKVADDKIEFDKKKPNAGYLKLVEQLVDSDEEIAGWGVAYIRDGAGFCCGLPLDDVKIKGIQDQAGKCQVTGKVFLLNEDQNGFTEHVAKK